MPKVLVQDTKGLYQQTGKGFHLDATATGIGLGLYGLSKESATIAVTHSTNTDVSFTQPANSVLKDLIFVNLYKQHPT